MDRHAIDFYRLKRKMGLSCGIEATRQYVDVLRQQPTKPSPKARSAAMLSPPAEKLPSRHFLHLALGRIGV
ncbi:hypothetical protein [Blastopirellula retiformator]|uniref:hypothetical protein n=1 Tax=Blastopirellula retiformator TaxID=2527970 RepID=UPI0011B42E4D|nr:hypothetical protein [Blastopirellula retiformator]